MRKLDSAKTIERLNACEKKKGGRLLSIKYVGIDAKYKFECKNKHRWETSAYHVLKRKTWCPYCLGWHKDISAPRKLAKSRGGYFLTPTFSTSHRKYSWQCNLGHTWEATYSKVAGGQWCPECASGLYERIAREAVQRFF